MFHCTYFKGQSLELYIKMYLNPLNMFILSKSVDLIKCHSGFSAGSSLFAKVPITQFKANQIS